MAFDDNSGLDDDPLLVYEVPDSRVGFGRGRSQRLTIGVLDIRGSEFAPGTVRRVVAFHRYGLDVGVQKRATRLSAAVPHLEWSKRPTSVTATPNPLNPTGVLTFTTLKSGRVTANLHDVHGRLVRRLVEDRLMPAGIHSAQIDGHNYSGQSLASGVDYYRVESVEGTQSGRVVVLK